MKQERALSILKTGANVFLTGEPGSGKTHTVNKYIAYLKGCGIEPVVTASTGIAATHIGGRTIHSWSGIGIKTKLEEADIKSIKSSKVIAHRIKSAKVLIIDEISMLAPNTLSMVDAICRIIKDSPSPFGGIQVVLVGDFFQLPPIIKNNPNDFEDSLLEEKLMQFAFDAPVWERAGFVTCYLTEQHRQDDADFLSLLAAIRSNSFAHISYLEKRKVGKQSAPGNVLKLFSHNADVDRINAEMLAKLPGDTKEFAMSSAGPEVIVEALIKGCMSPEKLLLKPGAAVMFTKNNTQAGFINGTLGIVQKFDKDSGKPIVKTKEGRIIEVETTYWEIEEKGKVIARITQLPLRLAWAITVHKSQGMSLDEAFMDLSGVFEFGQGYVALSRLRRLKGLHIAGWNEKTFRVHPEVLNKDEAFRDASLKAEAKFSSFSKPELEKMQNDFINSNRNKETSFDRGPLSLLG